MSDVVAITLLFAVLASSVYGFTPSPLSRAFYSPSIQSQPTPLATSKITSLFARGSKGGTKRDDLSYIETRDMTREEMMEYNKQSEEIMNSELTLMTGFSLLVSIPILYLCWVAYFSD